MKNSVGGLVAASLSCLNDGQDHPEHREEEPESDEPRHQPPRTELADFFFDETAVSVVAVLFSTAIVISGRLFLAGE